MWYSLLRNFLLIALFLGYSTIETELAVVVIHKVDLGFISAT